MKKLLCLVLCFIFALAMAVPAFASCGEDKNAGARTSNDTYIKSLHAIGYNGILNVETTLENFKLPATYKNNLVGGEPDDNNDFNKGCGTGSQYVRLIYSQYTANANEAITNLVAVYKDKGVEGDATLTIDGVTYTAVGGNSKKQIPLIVDWEKNYTAFDFNDNYDDSDCKKAVYLYFTTDSKAGNPITKLNIYYDSQNRNKENLVKELASNDVCDFNEGYKKSRAVYLQMERGGSSAGSIFNDTTSVVFICVGVAVILAVIGFVIFKKRKGIAQ